MAKKVINWNTDEPDEQQTNKPAANAADVTAKNETPTAIVNKNNAAAPPATIAAPQGDASDTSNADENNENEQKQTQQQSQQSNPQATTASKIGGVTLSGSAINPFMRAAANGHQTLMSKGSAMQQLSRGITPTAPQTTSNETDEDEYPENYSANQQNQQTVPQQASANNNNAADISADNANKDSASNDNANNEGDSDPNVQKQIADADVKEDLSDVVNENKTDAVKSGDQSNDNAASQADTDNKVEKQTDGNKVETSVENKDSNSVVADNVVATKTPTGYKYRYIDPKTGETTTYNSKVDYMARVSQKPTSDEEMKKEAKREKRRAIISAIGDGLSSLANLYFTGKGALSADFKPGMTEAAQRRIEALRAKWQKEKDNYDAIMLKANEDDQNAYYKDLAEARAKAKADREAADYEADKPLKDADREARLHKFEMDKANRPTQDELDNLKLANDLADEQNREKTGVDRVTQFNQDQQTKRNKYSVDNRKRGGGSGGSGGSKSEKNLIKTPNGKITPDNASVRQAYSKLAEAGLVSGTANSIEGMVTAIQDYYDGGGRNYTETDGFLGKNKTKVHRGRGSDSYLDADIDGLLGNNKKSSKKKISY